jgi:hypothetical protein
MPRRAESIRDPRRIGMTFHAWSIHLYGQWLDTVFLNASSETGEPVTADTVKRSLVAQGYDDRIVVRLARSISVHGN